MTLECQSTYSLKTLLLSINTRLHWQSLRFCHWQKYQHKWYFFTCSNPMHIVTTIRGFIFNFVATKEPRKVQLLLTTKVATVVFAIDTSQLLPLKTNRFFNDRCNVKEPRIVQLLFASVVGTNLTLLELFKVDLYWWNLFSGPWQNIATKTVLYLPWLLGHYDNI